MTGMGAGGMTGGHRAEPLRRNGITGGKGIGDSRYEEVEKQAG